MDTANRELVRVRRDTTRSRIYTPCKKLVGNEIKQAEEAAQMLANQFEGKSHSQESSRSRSGRSEVKKGRKADGTSQKSDATGKEPDNLPPLLLLCALSGRASTSGCRRGPFFGRCGPAEWYQWGGPWSGRS